MKLNIIWELTTIPMLQSKMPSKTYLTNLSDNLSLYVASIQNIHD